MAIAWLPSHAAGHLLLPESTGAGLAEALLVQTVLAQASYFAFGNSNSLATIDIAGAYTGLTAYNETAVGLLTFLIGYTGPLLCLLATLAQLGAVSQRFAATGSMAKPEVSADFSSFCLLFSPPLNTPDR